MKFLITIAIIFAVGCTSTVPTLTEYLLRSDKPTQYSVANQTAVTGLGALVVAPYINGLGLVLETDNGEVRAARDHRWAEPLRESLRTFMAGEISAQAGQVIRAHRGGEHDWQRTIDLRIDQLHGTARGEAKLVAYWTIFDTDKRTIVAENSFAETAALGADGYEALVQAEKKLLSQLAIAMAASL